MDLQRDKRTGGVRSCLIVRGEAGVVSTELYKTSGEGLTGVLTIHHSAPQHEGQREQDCEFLGHCYPENAFRAGHEVAQMFYEGREDRAYDEMDSWYYSRLVHEVS